MRQGDRWLPVRQIANNLPTQLTSFVGRARELAWLEGLVREAIEESRSSAALVLAGIVGLVWFGQKLDMPAVIGLALIIAGVGTINLFSSSVSH